jgi:hypothetical protein
MTLLKNLQNFQKNLKTHHFLALLGVIVLAYAVMQYSGRKGRISDAFSGASQQQQQPSPQPMNVAQPAEPAGQNEVYAAVSDVTTSSYGLPPSCTKGGNLSDPADLLPKDMNNQWAQLNPSGGSDFKNVNLLKAGYHSGIDTVGSSLRNANLQVRSEPPNPTNQVSPWMNTTIQPDLMRIPLELGSGPQ